MIQIQFVIRCYKLMKGELVGKGVEIGHIGPWRVEELWIQPQDLLFHLCPIDQDPLRKHSFSISISMVFSYPFVLTFLKRRTDLSAS